MANCKNFEAPYELRANKEILNKWGDLVVTPIKNELDRAIKEKVPFKSKQVAQEILDNIMHEYTSIKELDMKLDTSVQFLAKDNNNGLRGSIYYTMLSEINRMKNTNFSKACSNVFGLVNALIDEYYGITKAPKPEVENKVIQELREFDSRDPLVKYFGGAETAKNQFKAKLMTDFMQMTFINFDTLSRVKNDMDLNNAIAEFKNEQYLNIFRILNFAGKTNNKFPSKLYSSNTIVQTKALNILLKQAKQYLTLMRMFDEDTIRYAYKTRDTDRSQDAKVKVFEAYILLLENIFDKLLAENCPNVTIAKTNGMIQPKIRYIGGQNVLKYRFGTKNNYYKGWGDLDVDATKLMGNIASMIITKIPIIDPDTGQQVRKDYMTKERFFKVVNLLRDPLITNNITNLELKTVLRDLHKNPIENYIKAFNLLLDNWEFELNSFPEGVRQEGKRIIYSIYKRLFAMNDLTKEAPSIYQIDLLEMQINPLAKSYFLIEAVIGAMDRTSDSSYTSYSYNGKDGFVGPNEIQKNVNDSYEIDLSNSWDIDNNQRFTNDDRQVLLQTYQIKSIGNSSELKDEPKLMKFEISSGGITYYFKYDHSGTKSKLTYTTKKGLDSKSKDWKVLTIPSKYDLIEAIKDPGSAPTMEIRLFLNVLRMIDQIMFTSFSDQTLYELLEAIYSNSGDKFFMPLLDLAMNAARNHITYVLYENFKNDKRRVNAEEIDLISFVTNPDLYRGASYYAEQSTKAINYKAKRLRVFNPSLNQAIRSLVALAQLEITGEFYKANLHNSIGNAIPVNKMANLASMVAFQIQERIINNELSALKANLFAQNPSKFLGNTTKDGLNITTGLKKGVADFTESEHAISSILYDFYGCLSKEFKKVKVLENGHNYKVVKRTPIPKTLAEFLNQTEMLHVTTQPTTYSDKVTIYLFKSANRYWIKDNSILVDAHMIEKVLSQSGLTEELLELKNRILEAKLENPEINIVELLSDSDKENIKNNSSETGFCVDLTMSDDATIIRAINLTVGAQYRSIFNKVLSDYRYNLSDAKILEIIKDYSDNIFFQNILTKLNTVWAKRSSISLLLTSEELLEIMKFYLKVSYLQNAFSKYVSAAEKSLLTLSSNKTIDASAVLTLDNSNPYKIKLLHHFRNILTNDVIDSIIEYSNEDFSDILALRLSNPDIPVSTMLSDENIVKVINTMAYKEYIKLAEVDHSSVIEELHITKSEKFGVAPNKLLTYYATTLFTEGNILENNVFKARLAQELHKFLKNLVQYNVQFDLDLNGVPNHSVYQAIDALDGCSGKEGHTKFLEEWSNEYTKRLYLAKKRVVKDGVTTYEPASESDIKNATTEELIGGEFILNPILAKYFLSDYLLSENLRLAITGASFVHKDTHSHDDDPLMDAIKEAASREGAQYKRLVIIPATLQYFLQKSIVGIPPQMNIAILSDAQSHAFNINGICATGKHTLDAHDGSGFDHPLWDILQNLSLQDQAVGNDKKNIMHTLSNYGVAELQKYAVFSMYNERMRQSRLSPNSFYNLVKNMSSIEWDKAYDLNTDLYGNKYKNMLNELKTKNLYFKGKGGIYYEVTGLYLSDAENFKYTRYIRQVDNKGNVIKQLPAEEIEIRNIWDLMEALGGTQSVDLINGKFIYGDTNLSTTVNYINNIGTYKGSIIVSETSGLRVPEHVPTLELTDQPLKMAFIHTATNASGFKNSALYKNGKEAWKAGTKLMYITSDTYNIGPQMDADHVVVNGEHASLMTEPSQIISALEANGFTHEISKEAYLDLGKVAMAAIAKYDNATRDYIASGYSIEKKHALYHLLGTLIYKEILKDSSEVSTSTAVMNLIELVFGSKNIHNHKDDVFKIPFSDPNIFAKSISTFVSTLNKTAIKRKFQGEGAVMVPAYDIMTYFYVPSADGQYHQYMMDDILKKACAKYPDLEIQEAVSLILRDYQLEEERHPKTLDKLLPGDKVHVKFADGTEVYYDLETNYDLYLNLKGFKLPGYSMNRSLKGATFTYAVIKKGTNEVITRNLRPLETTWTVTANGTTTQYNLYDLYDVRNAIRTRREGIKEKALEKAKEELNRAKTLIKSFKKDTAGWTAIYNNIVTLNQTYLERLKEYKTEDLQLQKNINNALKKLSEGVMIIDNGVSIAIDKDSLKTKAAEMIMSKIYAQQLGILNGDSLADILENDDYFLNQININPTSNAYDVCYLTDVGNHLYISSTIKEGMTENIRLTLNNRFDFVTDSKHRRYRVDEDGNHMYLVGEDVEEEVTGEDGSKKKLYVYKKYIDFYVDSAGNEVLYIADPKKAADLFKHTQFTGVQFNPKFENQEYVDGLFTLWESRGRLKDYRALVGTPVVGTSLTLLTSKYLETRKQEQALKRKTSFRLSLDYTVGRIPAQAQLSFMLMRCVAFLNTNKNVVHVSHYQTWLQGSDYDIDKAYIMGNEFNDNGLYVGWSPYFDYTSESTLNLSMLLPTPNGNVYEWENTADAFDISDYAKLFKQEHPTIDAYIKLLRAVDQKTSIKYNKGRVDEATATKILEIINNHNLYFINNPRIASSAFKNSVSSKVRRVVSDVRNALASYTPIGMEEPREAADNSQSGEAVKTMTGMDPFTKWIMTVQNMSGKKVIGIAATGEKIFFALSYYYNELISSGDTTWFKNAFFLKVLYKLNIIDPITLKGEIVELFRNAVDNINFYSNENMKKLWDDTVEAYLKGVIQDLAELDKYILENFNLRPDQSLVISALLSAATDNAKELILDKINAGPEFAGLYLHMIILGVDFLEISKLMTSPTMNALKELLLTNAFSSYNFNTENSLNRAFKISEHGPIASQYYITETFDFDSKTSKEETITAAVLQKYKLCMKLELDLEKATSQNMTEADYKLKLVQINETTLTVFKLKDFLADNFRLFAKYYNVIGDINILTIKEDKSSLVRNKPVWGKTAEVNRFIEDYNRTLSIVNSMDINVLNAIQTLHNLASITTTLGQAVLSSNQGFETDFPGKLSRLLKLENIMFEAEKQNLPKKLRKAMFANTAEKDKLISNFAKQVSKRNITLREEDVKNALEEAVQHDIFDGGFSIERFLTDEEYRRVAIRYYALIKDSYNIYDVIDKVPHFNAIFKVYNIILTVDNNFSRKFKYARSIIKDLVELKLHSPYFTEDELSKLTSTIDAHFMCEWLSSINIRIPIGKGCEYFDNKGKRHPVLDGQTYIIDLSTDEGRATFKLYMETHYIRSLAKGWIPGVDLDTEYIPLRLNALIRQLKSSEFEDKSSGVSIPYLKAPINMLRHDSYSDSSRYEAIQTALEDLQKVKAQGSLSIADFLFLYNMIVNLNRYGADRLTALFGKVINNKNSLVFKYNKAIGNLDYICDDRSIEMNRLDILMAMAPLCGEKTADRHKTPYIRVKRPGSEKTILMRRIQKGALQQYTDSEQGEIYAESEGLHVEDAVDSLLSSIGEEFAPSKKKEFKIVNYTLDQTGDINSKDVDYWRYFTLRLPFMTNLINLLLITDSDISLNTKIDMENLAFKIIKMIERNSIVTDLNCHG